MRLSQDWITIKYTEISKKTLPLVSIIVGGALVLFIFCYIICFGKGENSALEFETLYSNVAPSFLTDYDKENPLTKRAGTERLLDLQI